MRQDGYFDEPVIAEYDADSAQMFDSALLSVPNQNSVHVCPRIQHPFEPTHVAPVKRSGSRPGNGLTGRCEVRRFRCLAKYGK